MTQLLFETLTTSVSSVAQRLVTITHGERQPNPQVANNSGTHNEFLLQPVGRTGNPGH